MISFMLIGKLYSLVFLIIDFKFVPDPDIKTHSFFFYHFIFLLNLFSLMIYLYNQFYKAEIFIKKFFYFSFLIFINIKQNPIPQLKVLNISISLIFFDLSHLNIL